MSRRTEHYRAEFVTSFPTPLAPGTLYISTSYATAAHLCPCGCGGEVVTKLSQARYRIIFDGEVSLAPSVAATALVCNSHYFITRGQVDWHRKLTVQQTARARDSDQRALEAQRRPKAVDRPLLKRWRRENRSAGVSTRTVGADD
jgi:Family of unknown function (DUF6527)